VVLSRGDPQVQEAFETVESVLTANGFVPDSRLPVKTSPAAPALYIRYDPTGLRQSGPVDVSFGNGRVVVGIYELGNRTGRLKANNKTLDSLRKALVSRYGAGRVKVAKTREP
jgi:hypothetical protein